MFAKLDCIKSTETIVVLVGVDLEAMKSLVDMMYANSISISLGNIVSVTSLARKFQIEVEVAPITPQAEAVVATTSQPKMKVPKITISSKVRATSTTARAPSVTAPVATAQKVFAPVVKTPKVVAASIKTSLTPDVPVTIARTRRQSKLQTPIKQVLSPLPQNGTAAKRTNMKRHSGLKTPMVVVPLSAYIGEDSTARVKRPRTSQRISGFSPETVKEIQRAEGKDMPDSKEALKKLIGVDNEENENL